MAQGSPSAQRVIEILNFFADHPGQAFTLTDVVRALKLSRATAHAFLTTLANADYLFRSSDKSYVLGPALASVAQAASRHLSPIQIAQPEMRRLADEFDGVCSAVFRERNEVVVRERASSRNHLGLSLPRGQRLPLRPPFGGIFFAWSPPAQAEAWLDQLDPPVSARMREQMFHCMDFAREHGFQFAYQNRPDTVDPTSADWLFIEEFERRPVMLATELEPERTYVLSSVTSPVFGNDGRIAFVMALAGLTQTLTGAEIAVIGEKLRTTCDRISGFLGGRRPE
jgi:DNA-binding IclR family transcriptional regulator